MDAPPILTLLTDFGLADGTVAAMKAQILGLLPDARIVDLSHEIPPQDLRAGAFLLARCARDFPPGTVHVAVVDPGVGTPRRAIAARDVRGSWFVGPDNGLLGRAVGEGALCFELDATRVRPRSRPSATFHGRDLFAPAAARLGAGDPPSAFGELGEAPLVLPLSASRVGTAIHGEVVWIDHFGNALTEIEAAWLPPEGTPLALACGSVRLTRIVRTYAEVERGEALAYVGSADTLELGVRDGNLARQYGVERGTTLTLEVPTRST